MVFKKEKPELTYTEARLILNISLSRFYNLIDDGSVTKYRNKKGQVRFMESEINKLEKDRSEFRSQ